MQGGGSGGGREGEGNGRGEGRQEWAAVGGGLVLPLTVPFVFGASVLVPHLDLRDKAM